MTNPLLSEQGLPTFSQVKPKHITPAVDTILTENRQWLAERLKQKIEPTWDNLLYPLNENDNRLDRMWSPVSHLNAVMNTEELRSEYNSCLPKLSEYHTEIGQNQDLYLAIKHMHDNASLLGLDDVQIKVLNDALLSFKLSGIALEAAEQNRYGEINKQLSQLSANFSDNVLDATHAWFKHITDVSELAGLSESALNMAAQSAEQRELTGWVITLDFPSYIAVMQYADNRLLRAEVFHAYTTRSSELGQNPDQDNTQVIRDIMRLRQESAELLGYANYAEVSLASKMADSTDKVIGFLRDLAAKSKPFADQEYTDIVQFAKDELGMTEEVQVWDVSYISEKMKESRFRFTEQDLKPYFPAERVIDGLFKLVSQLYNVQITPSEQPVDLWHADVRFYQIHNQAGELAAEFYLDLYARQHKRGGAWMSDFCGRFKRAQGVQTPVAFMTCNSSPPIGDQPALFTHDEVVTLFHEFGHGLHHMMTQVDYPDVSGISGVEWDAVELPSQFMENWCWEREVLDMISGHWETGEALPQELFDKMLAARHFQGAMGMVRQLEFSLFDMLLHIDPAAADEGQLNSILQAVREEVAVIKQPSFNRMVNSFSHIFAGGYAAGYYSYKWAEVLSADAYARFEEDGLFNPETGQSFLGEVLQMGGSRPAMESFVAFRGREPEIDALLRHSGLSAAA
uniref:oligopeptidase A n=1 Tax=uncultured Thiotrichaceae bacterium TaxID=298394 RepID=A0A6S6UP45_9GAMM|nr:MAG: Oligopeptidase A (EC [uncultured Thiotrichaceae bacterium]